MNFDGEVQINSVECFGAYSQSGQRRDTGGQEGAGAFTGKAGQRNRDKIGVNFPVDR